MAWRIIWTDEALSDLESCAEYIAQDSPEAAARLVRALFAAGETLEEFPERRPLVPDLEGEPVRELLHGNYRILFELSTTHHQVEILAVVHVRRDLRSLWSQRE